MQEQDNKRKMIFLSSSFPYGKGEKTFITPELERLVEDYDVTLVSHADEEDKKDVKNLTKVDQSIPVLHFESHTSLAQKVWWGLCYFADKDCWQEIKEIIKGKKHFLMRLYQSMGFYILTMNEIKNIQKANLLSQEEYVLCYSYWYTYYCYAYLKLKKKFPNLKVIARTHGVDLYNERTKGMRQPFKRIMDKSLDGIIFAAQYAKDYYLRSFSDHSNEKRYAVCRLGVPETVKWGHKRTATFCLLSCAYTIPLKRIELIIQALAVLQNERIHWIHIGDGNCFMKLSDYAHTKLADKDNITYEFKGYMDNCQIRKIYEEGIDGFITTSSTEGGCPVSIQEAMSYGVPVIGTDVGGITEMIHKNGFLLPANPSPWTVAEAIKKLYYMEKEEIEQLSRNSYETWQDKFNLTVNLNNLLVTIHNMEGS